MSGAPASTAPRCCLLLFRSMRRCLKDRLIRRSSLQQFSSRLPLIRYRLSRLPAVGRSVARSPAHHPATPPSNNGDWPTVPWSPTEIKLLGATAEDENLANETSEGWNQGLDVRRCRSTRRIRVRAFPGFHPVILLSSFDNCRQTRRAFEEAKRAAIPEAASAGLSVHSASVQSSSRV